MPTNYIKIYHSTSSSTLATGIKLESIMYHRQYGRYPENDSINVNSTNNERVDEEKLHDDNGSELSRNDMYY